MTSESPPQRLQTGSDYRPDIDGLRAIAVGGVLLFHAFPAALPGGFVGVDVFFVISGFLITQIVRRETLAARFSISGFYERRIRRIFPALAVVLAVTSLVALVVLAPGDLKTYGRSVPPSVAFGANLYFWTRGSYFNPPQDVRPLLHLWSLGVEEQFYLFWPPLLILARRFSPAALGAGLLVIVLVSLGADEVYVRRDSLAAFYSTPLRAWEPLLGALLASGWVRPPRALVMRQWLAATGLAAILLAMALLRESTPFPGLSAVPACLGAALLLAAGMSGTPTIISRLLSLRPIVWIGTASYSLYLWHWPILTFLRLGRPQEPSAAVMVFGLLLSVGLSALTLVFVEQRFRRRPPNGLPRRRLFAFTLVCIAVLALVGSGLSADEGLRGRARGFALQALTAEHDASPLWKRCLDAKFDPVGTSCLFGASTPAAPDVLLWGDSIAASWVPAVADWSLQHRLKGRLAAHITCLPALNVDVHEREGATTVCRSRNAAVLDLVGKSPNLKVVFLSARWMMYLAGTDAVGAETFYISQPGGAREPASFHRVFIGGVEGLIQALGRVGPPGLKIVIIGPTPEFAVGPVRCAERAWFVHLDPARCLSESASVVAARQAASLEALREIAARHPNVTLVSPSEILCDAQSCHAMIDGHFAFIDDVHLTATGARRLGASLAQVQPPSTHR